MVPGAPVFSVELPTNFLLNIVRYPIAALALCACTAANADATLHDQVVTLYSFSPHTLSQPDIEAKSKELDAFWSSVKAGGSARLDELRQELRRPDSPSFFGYDGAKLLLSLSNTSEDRSLALTAMTRADLQDLQRDDYFLTVHSFAVDQLDTSEAAFKILRDDQFQVFIPQHYLTLNQEMCLLYLLLPTRETFYLEKAERRLLEEKSVTAQKSLLTLLAYTVTKSGDAAIARFAASSDEPQESRSYANKILKATRGMESASIAGFSTASYESLKEQQRKLFARVSDEALDESQGLRVQIRRKGAH